MEARKETKKILIIDDEPHLVELVANRLKAKHLNVVTAVLGKEGLVKAREEKPDLILLDILMPDLDGFQVLCRLKESPDTCHIPVVMLTVRKWSQDIKKAMDGGAVDYIVKPFEPTILWEKIERVLKDGEKDTAR
jgi:DNA-binding response OmpR family regulator